MINYINSLKTGIDYVRWSKIKINDNYNNNDCRSIIAEIRSLLHIRGYMLGLIDAYQVTNTNLYLFFFLISVGDDPTPPDFIYYGHIPG